MAMTEAAISVRGLKKSFGEIEAVKGIDLAVPRGTVLSLLGPNGAGKTTAVRVLTTILTPDEGDVRVLGHDVVTEAPLVRSLIGLAGQYAAVDDNLTGRENLRLVAQLTHLPRALGRARADELLEQFDLTDAAGRPVKTYSGGMRRRLDLAAALVHRPPVLFLDEPTTGLDPRGRSDLWGVIEELVSDGTTLLLTTQYLEEADRLADRIAVIDHGVVIAEGTSAELKAQLGTTIIELTFAPGNQLDDAKSLLVELGPTDIGADSRTLEIKVDDGPVALLRAVRLLDGAHLQPIGVAVREPTLDDVFLQLTGRPTGDEEAS
jgi:ABC-2 type transport system ATP-binding protein